MQNDSGLMVLDKGEYESHLIAFYNAACPLGIVLNLVLLYIIAVKSPRTMREYPILLFNAALIDTLKSLSLWLVQPRHIFFIHKTLGPIRFLGGWAAHLVLSLTVSLIFGYYLDTALHFGYYYICTCPNRPLSQADFKTAEVICAFADLFIIAQTISLQFGVSDPEVIRRQLSSGVQITDDTVVFGIDGHDNPVAVLSWLLCTLPVFPLCIFTVFVRYKVNKRLDQMGVLSASTRDILKKLTMTMTIQTALLFAVTTTPVVLSLLTLSGPSRTLLTSYGTFIPAAISPIVNALLSTLLITAFRKTVFGWFVPALLILGSK